MAEDRGPIVFLDVDGPLNPYDGGPELAGLGFRRHEMRPDGWEDPETEPLQVWLNPAHGARILSLPGRIVWATTWEVDANRWIGPEVGLPELPVVDWPGGMGVLGLVHWKTRRLIEWADGRPFVWIDDQLTEMDVDIVAAEHPGEALLYQVDPAVGLEDEDFEAIDRWLRDLAD